MGKAMRRFIKLFTDRAVWVRQITVTALAAGIAWLIGDSLITNGGLVAAIVASLSTRISVHKSIREGFGQILGTAIGAGIALIAVWAFDFGFITVAFTVFLCAVIARALHLGEVASINVPVTALIVIGPGLSENTAIHRTQSTLVGAAIAILFSYFSHPKTPAGRTIDQITKLGNKCAELLAKMAAGVAAGFTEKDAGNWLAQARLLVEEIPKVRAQALEAKSFARWFPTAESDEAEELYARGVAVEHTVVQVRTIARTLFDTAVQGGVATGTQEQISQALTAASVAISDKLKEFTDNDGRNTLSSTDEVRQAGADLTEKLIEEAKSADPEQLARSISIATNLERIADSLDQSSPALDKVATPDEPAEQKVIKDFPITRKIKKIFRKYF
ncbi:MAG: FUSC family protein [Candidatus Nanopelagicaceae bacterium]